MPEREINESLENSIMQACSGFTPQYDVGFDTQLNLTKEILTVQKKDREQKIRGEMCLHIFPLVNGVNREKRSEEL